MLALGKAELSLEAGLRREWLLSNGLGGWASSTAILCNARKWHGLLVASEPSLRRTLLLANTEDWLELDGERFSLSTNIYPGAVHPQGFGGITRFVLDPLPRARFDFGDARIEKTIALVHGENTVVLCYAFSLQRPAKFSVTPLITNRRPHELKRGMPQHEARQAWRELTLSFPTLSLRISSDLAEFRPSPTIFYNIRYPLDEERGEAFEEDLFAPGSFELALPRGETSFHIVCTTEPTSHPRPAELIELERARLQRTAVTFYANTGIRQSELATALALAADSFLARTKHGATILAGYPWFGEWGRDAMIALPGLLLTSKRFEEARAVLRHFALLANPLVPNLITPEGVAVNSADASLWFINAAYAYASASGDLSFIEKELYPKIKEIIRSYAHGLPGITLDKDGLLSLAAGLTWMDARIDGQPVTPRAGKPVEVNALWYNALRIGEHFANAFGDAAFASECTRAARMAKASFQKFWNEAELCLYDVIEPNDASVRPNQLIALSLPFRPLEEEKELLVLRKVWQELYTPLGLRTLSPKDPNYRPFYRGTLRERDAAYHQGAVWPWLLGAFLLAMRRLMPHIELAPFLQPFEDHLRVHGLGTVSELFEADSLRPDGCFSQAWSVAEILRAKVELGI
ncbi:MAG: amylo-alpha-1,6-glucosidase [Candidatus Micrarchaeia archaeon]